MEDAFWTTPAMVNYGMTAMPMEIRFETLMGSFFQGNGNNHDAETRYRLWITSYNQPGLLFSSIVTSAQDPIRNYGGKFPTLLKTLIDDSRIGTAQIDLVNEGPKFASLVMRRINQNAAVAGGDNSKRAMPWFGCRLEIADDARVREHLTTMVLSLRRERDEEKRKREELEAELACYKKPLLKDDDEDEHERFQDLLNTIASVPTTSSPGGHILSNPPSNGKDNDEIIDEDVEPLIPTDFADILGGGGAGPSTSINDANSYHHRIITPIIRTSQQQQPSSSLTTPTSRSLLIPSKLTPPLTASSSNASLRSTENILRGVATYVLCALCPEGDKTAEPDESSIIDHIVSQHFDGESKTCHGCPTRTEVRDISTHMKMHMSKLYECKYCGKRGTKRNVLQAHLRTHTGEKPYECPYCSRRFADASTLRRHRTTHTGEMRAACPICGRVISRRDNVKAHLRNNHGIEWNGSSSLLTLKELEKNSDSQSTSSNNIPMLDLNTPNESESDNPRSNQSLSHEDSEFETKPSLNRMFN